MQTAEVDKKIAMASLCLLRAALIFRMEKEQFLKVVF